MLLGQVLILEEKNNLTGRGDKDWSELFGESRDNEHRYVGDEHNVH
jgi:hypothetical protein